jgi:hypothetical protein
MICGRRSRQLVAALVLLVAVVTADPMDAQRVDVHQREQLLPQIPIRDHAAGRPSPPVRLPPARPPFGDAVHDVLRVAEQVDLARLLERLERLDGRRQLHAIVGRSSKSADDLLMVRRMFQNRRVSSRTRVPEACTIREDGDLFLRTRISIRHV